MSQEEKKSKGKKKATAGQGNAKLLGYGFLVTFLMVWIFILGVLTGRGDVNYLLQRLGLYKTDLAARLGLGESKPVAAALPLPQPAEENKALAEAVQKPVPEAETAEKTAALVPPVAKVADPAAKTPAEAAKKSGPAGHDAKKTKGTGPPKPDQDHSLAAKFNFQNSLDTPTRKAAKTAPKKEGGIHTASIAPNPAGPGAKASGEEKKKVAGAYQVRVASYRTTEEAEKIMADLKKKGFNVSLQKGKDKAGSIYVIKTGCYSNKAEAEKVTKKLKEAKMSGQIQEIH